jgi:proteasome assembly chaperone (PAC2) family protein
MPEALDLWEQPKAERVYMIAGWRQWADAGSVSSGLPEYLVQQTEARPIGKISPDGFYLFQIPGTHDLVRPVVEFDDGYPKSLEISRNEFFYTGDEERGVVIFLGDEPHLDIERYTAALLKAAKTLQVKRIIGLGGVYGELPYNKERIISSTYSLPRLKDEVLQLAVTLSDYHGGASIGSYLCRRAGDQNIEYVGLYAFVPAYSFAEPTQIGNSIRIDNDFMAWLGVMRRVNYMLKIGLNLSDLETRSEQVIKVMDNKIAELDRAAPQLGVQDYLARLAEGFNEVTFAPLSNVWEEEMRRLLDEDEEGEEGEEA